MMTEEDEVGGSQGGQVIAQYQTTRIRALWTSYKRCDVFSMFFPQIYMFLCRIFQLTNDSIVTLDPSNFAVTNTFNYSAISKLGPDDKVDDQFNVEVDKTTYVYKTAHRSQLLCQLLECIVRRLPTKLKAMGPFNAQRIRKNGARVDCRLVAAPHGVVEMDIAGRILQEYRYVDIKKVGTDERSRAFFFKVSGRAKLFFLSEIESLCAGISHQIKQIGISSLSMLTGQDINDALLARTASYNATGAPVSVFDVNKSTKRSVRPVPRQLHVTEEFIVEKDASGFQFVSFQRVRTIYAIVRSWTNPREFTIEYEDGSARTYTCAVRDTLLAMLLDITHAIGNVRVIVTGEVSDSLRLMPRFAEEEYQSSLTDAFFGASSIEAWFLSRLAKACKAVPLESEAVVAACRELNANVPCPGITPNSDMVQVRTCLSGVLRNINSMTVASMASDRVDHSRAIALMLQTLYRIIPSVAGFKGFVEVREVDTRSLLLNLIKFNNDFVNYWTLEVLSVLCRCPLSPRNQQQEFVNKHTLLTDNLLKCLIDLMSARIDSPGEDDSFVEDVVGEGNKVAEGAPSSAPMSKLETPGGTVSPNAAPTAHLAGLVDDSAGSASSSSAEILRRVSAKRRDRDSTHADPEGAFFPNSLVVVGAAALLESIVSSQRDTSSPELMHKVLDLLSERCEVLVHMLRSTSFLIMENAAILMFVLLRNRPPVASVLREMALSECLVLKHFYNGVFSPSVSQRFISRFLVATWMSGSEKLNPGKALLMRMIPSGLTEYLKFASISEQHRKNLDEMEEEFYANFGAALRTPVRRLFPRTQ